MKPQANAPQASAAWSIPEIRVIKDDQGRLRIDESIPTTYGAYTARQFLATAEANPKYREGMTKRPSTSSIKITYANVNERGEIQRVGVREIFCRMEEDALVLTHFENEEGEKVKDLPIAIPEREELVDLDTDLDDSDRLHELALAEFSDEPLPDSESEPEPEPEPEPFRPEPVRGRRLPTGPLRRYDEETESAPAPATETSKNAPGPESAPLASEMVSPVPKLPGAGVEPLGSLMARALNDSEAASLRALIEAKAGQSRWPNALLIQAAERHPGDRKLQNQHLANLLRVSLDPLRAESRTPLASALRSIIEEVHAYSSSVLDRDPLKADKLALQPFARAVLDSTSIDPGHVKTVSGASQRTPAQVLAKLEDPKLARATRVKLLLEIVPEMIESWRPDKESTRSEAANENSPAVVRRLFSVANQQRQQRKFIDNGSAFKKAGERYAGLETKLPKAPVTDLS